MTGHLENRDPAVAEHVLVVLERLDLAVAFQPVAEAVTSLGRNGE
jgi:hypothetical protein